MILFSYTFEGGGSLSLQIDERVPVSTGEALSILEELILVKRDELKKRATEPAPATQEFW